MYCSFDRLRVPRGIISIVGSGGKTSLLRFMARSLRGRILLTTTTHILPFPGISLIKAEPGLPEEMILQQLRAAQEHDRIICLGTPCPDGKLKQPPIDPESLLSLFDHILIEADGAKGLPLKAHRSFEPVIHPGTALTICVAGASGIGLPAVQACHCPEIFTALAGSGQDEPVLPGHIARVLNAEDLADLYLINQTDLLPDPETALKLCADIKKPAIAGSLLKRRFL